MATAADEPRSPALANVVVVVGFVVIFTTFATGSPWSWIIGGILLLAGALWAGAASDDPILPDAAHPGDPLVEDDTEGDGVVHGDGIGGPNRGRTH